MSVTSVAFARQGPLRRAHPYADGANIPQVAYDKFTAGQWIAPPGTLIVVDDVNGVAGHHLQHGCRRGHRIGIRYGAGR